MYPLTLHDLLRAAHIGAGFLGLVVFWLPVLVRKGGRMHTVCGWVFTGCAGVVIATSLVVCVVRFVDPVGVFGPKGHPSAEDATEYARRVRLFTALLGAVAVYTLVPLVLAIQVIRTRDEPEHLAGPVTTLLLWSEVGVGLALIGFSSAQLTAGLSPGLSAMVFAAGVAGLGAARWDLRFVGKSRFGPMDWWYKHMEFMLRTGIAFHTAFLVVGAKPWLGTLGAGPWAWVPWMLPSAVGIPAVWLWVRHYRRRFDELAPPVRTARS